MSLVAAIVAGRSPAITVTLAELQCSTRSSAAVATRRRLSTRLASSVTRVRAISRRSCGYSRGPDEVMRILESIEEPVRHPGGSRQCGGLQWSPRPYRPTPPTGRAAARAERRVDATTIRWRDVAGVAARAQDAEAAGRDADGPLPSTSPHAVPATAFAMWSRLGARLSTASRRRGDVLGSALHDRAQRSQVAAHGVDV